MVLNALAMQYQAQADRNKVALATRKKHIRQAKPAAKTQKQLAAAKDERAEAELVISRLKQEGGEPSVANIIELSSDTRHLPWLSVANLHPISLVFPFPSCASYPRDPQDFHSVSVLVSAS